MAACYNTIIRGGRGVRGLESQGHGGMSAEEAYVFIYRQRRITDTRDKHALVNAAEIIKEQARQNVSLIFCCIDFAVSCCYPLL